MSRLLITSFGVCPNLNWWKERWISDGSCIEAKYESMCFKSLSNMFRTEIFSRRDRYKSAHSVHRKVYVSYHFMSQIDNHIIMMEFGCETHVIGNIIIRVWIDVLISYVHSICHYRSKS